MQKTDSHVLVPSNAGSPGGELHAVGEGEVSKGSGGRPETVKQVEAGMQPRTLRQQYDTTRLRDAFGPSSLVHKSLAPPPAGACSTVNDEEEDCGRQATEGSFDLPRLEPLIKLPLPLLVLVLVVPRFTCVLSVLSGWPCEWRA